MIAGARVEVAPYKRHPADFVLWKPSKPGEPEWESPWGPGRPGWHLECSAMIEQTIGPLPIDIHGGGHDLIFPHHENEIAQSVCADHAPALARYWMHNGFLTLEAEKMSKSLGNVLLVHELVKKVPGEVIRWALLSAHYRAPLDWTGELLAQARATLDRLYGVLQRAKHVQVGASATPDAELLAPLLDDLNTPGAIHSLSSAARALDEAVRQDSAEAAGRKADLLALASIFGVLQQDPDAWFGAGADDQLKARIETLVAQRTEARKAKDWAAADRIRGELADLGVELLDGPAGAVSWRLRETA
jgi:cysteinyl-tRNA synthetase